MLIGGQRSEAIQRFEWLPLAERPKDKDRFIKKGFMRGPILIESALSLRVGGSVVLGRVSMRFQR